MWLTFALQYCQLKIKVTQCRKSRVNFINTKRPCLNAKHLDFQFPIKKLWHLNTKSGFCHAPNRRILKARPLIPRTYISRYSKIGPKKGHKQPWFLIMNIHTMYAFRCNFETNFYPHSGFNSDLLPDDTPMCLHDKVIFKR